MKIGSELHKIRTEKNMTLEELSRLSGVSLGTLSKIENDKLTGSLECHNQICKALGISITDIYKQAEDETKTVDMVQKDTRTEHFHHSDKAKYEMLVSQVMGKLFMPIAIKLAAGGETPKEQTREGIDKFVFVLKGRITAFIGDVKYDLHKGDGMFFDGGLPHRFRNEGEQPAEALYIISPPLF